MKKQITKLISLSEEDILNLQNARDRIFQTLDYGGNNHYEALEIFTLDAIIKRFQEKQREENSEMFFSYFHQALQETLLNLDEKNPDIKRVIRRLKHLKNICKGKEKMKQLVRFDNLTAKEILALSEGEINRMIFLERSLNLLNKNLVQNLQLIKFVQETIEEKKNDNSQTL